MTRGEIKELGGRIDRDPGVRADWEGRARAKGVELEPGTPGKKLVRIVLDRGEGAQVRTNPIARDEAFACSHCAREVPLGGRRPRDHCPYCLYSQHVDVVPGDRAERCGGALIPVGVAPGHDGLDILYRCERCGAARRNRVLDDLLVPDEQAAIRTLSRWVVNP